MEEEDAGRPSRERESLVGERTRIINRMKAALARLGIRGFKPELRKAPQRLEALRTPEGVPIPPNTLAEIRRDMARLGGVREQIEALEQARLERLERAPAQGPDAMVRLLARVIGVGVETADMLVREVLSRTLRDRRAVARYAGLTGSPDESGGRRRENTLALLKDLSAGISGWLSYQSREDEGTQSPTETLDRGWGSCRDFAVLFVEAARSLGFGARVVSGYLYNPDQDQVGSGGAGSTHAWAEIYVPGAGWITFDPTNRALGGLNLIPVAVARDIRQAMPVT